MNYGKITQKNGLTQEQALNELAKLAAKGAIHPKIRAAAIAITQDCPSRDDMCEIQAIFDAVKHGDDRVPGLAKGVRYLADPRLVDYYTAPGRLLANCEQGFCAEDCDGHSILLAALLLSVGFIAGLRVWRPPNKKSYEHVYAVVAVPKNPRGKQEALGLDTTHPPSTVGWEPPISSSSQIRTAWIR